MAVRVGADADDRDRLVDCLEEREDRRAGAVVRDVQDLGRERLVVVQHHLLRVGLGFVREEHAVAPIRQQQHERVVVGVGVRAVPAAVGAEDVEAQVADDEDVALHRVLLRDVLDVQRVQEAEVRRGVRLGRVAAGVGDEACRDAGQDGGQADVVVVVRVGGGELGIGAAVDEDGGAAGRLHERGVALPHVQESHDQPAGRAGPQCRGPHEERKCGGHGDHQHPRDVAPAAEPYRNRDDDGEPEEQHADPAGRRDARDRRAGQMIGDAFQVADREVGELRQGDPGGLEQQGHRGGGEAEQHGRGDRSERQQVREDRHLGDLMEVVQQQWRTAGLRGERGGRGEGEPLRQEPQPRRDGRCERDDAGGGRNRELEADVGDERRIGGEQDEHRGPEDGCGAPGPPEQDAEQREHGHDARPQHRRLPAREHDEEHA